MRHFFSVLSTAVSLMIIAGAVVVYEFVSQQDHILPELGRTLRYALAVAAIAAIFGILSVLEQVHHNRWLKLGLSSAKDIGLGFLVVAISQWDHGEHLDRIWYFTLMVGAFPIVYFVKWILQEIYHHLHRLFTPDTKLKH